MNQLPETGFLRLSDVIGEDEVTEKQAAANREFNKQAEADAIKNGRLDKNGKPVYSRRPITARPHTPAIFPVKKSCWWQGIRDGRFPKPVKFGGCTMWKIDDIRDLIASA